MQSTNEKKGTTGFLDKLSQLLILFGTLLIAGGLLIFILTFYKVILAELDYAFNRPKIDVRVEVSNPTHKKNVVVPVDADFGIVIPKIGANAKIVPNVNPYNEREYQVALTKGVAHARGTVYPGNVGNVFLFAHSAGNFYDANRYNAIFYLLSKMKAKDDIFLFYHKNKFRYTVTSTRIVNPDQVQYLGGAGVGKTVTLMTCWPPGTTLKRLLVIGTIAPL